MNKFDTIISKRIEVIGEDATQPASTNPLQPVQNQNPLQQNQPQQGQPQQGQPQQGQPQQNQPPTQQSNPEQELAKIFQSMKFSNTDMTTQTLNNAIRSAGNVPGLSEFFSNVTYDPKQGFRIAQQQQQSQPQQQTSLR